MRIILMLLAFCFSINGYAANCGKQNQRPCTVLERIPSCDRGLIEARGRCISRKKARARPRYCGRNNQRPCKIIEFIPSCARGLIEARGRCMTRKAARTRPRYCGSKNQRPCNILEFVPSCGRGLVEIRGKCLARGKCGANGQRPCGVLERVPSCQPGLKENFKRNVCEKLLPGETPFLGGVKSLSEFYGDGIKTVCKQSLGSIRIKSRTPIGVGANCAKNVFVGAACEYLASLLGADVAGTIGDAADTPRQIADSKRQFKLFQQKVDRAYHSAACKKFAEKLRPAKRHRRSRRFRCPRGQFADPNGYCYSCPRGYTRTLEKVTSRRACVDKPAGELARSACAVYVAATRDFAKAASCTTEILSSGVFTQKKIGFRGASREFCMAAGEFSYSLVSVLIPSKSPKQKAKQINTSLQKFIAKAKKQYKKVSDVKQKFDNAKTVAGQSKNMVDKFKRLKKCR